jgi:hypothetical protein
MKMSGHWFPKADDVKCTGSGGSHHYIVCTYVTAQTAIIVGVIIQMKLVPKFCRPRHVTEK